MWPLRAPSSGSSWLSLLYLWSSPWSCPRSFLLRLKHVGVPRAPEPRGINLGPDTPPILVQPAQKNQTAGSDGENQIQSVPNRKCKSVQQPRPKPFAGESSDLQLKPFRLLQDARAEARMEPAVVSESDHTESLFSDQLLTAGHTSLHSASVDPDELTWS